MRCACEAMANLVSNAATYDEDAPIAIQVADQGQTYRSKVINDGPGVAAAHLPHLSEPLRRGS
jgi:signal transduction histidine kinase